MLTVTDAAGAHLARMLKQQNAPQDKAVRFVYDGRGIGLHQDSEQAGDATFQHEGRTVLLMDVQVSELLAAGTLDFEGAKLTLQHPKEGE